MNSLALALVVLAAFCNNAQAQCLPYGPMVSSAISPLMPTVIQSNSVANTLADTLSLLTVSSLLSETLPMSPNVIATVPAYAPACGAALSTCAPVVGGCGCGCGYGFNGLNAYYL